MKHTKENKILFPKYDIAFKSLFKGEENQPVAESFLKAMLDLPGEERLIDIRVKDPELLPQYETGKLSILDVLFELPDGEKIMVEMQKSRIPGMKERLIHEWAHVAAGQLSQGQDYENFRKVIFVVISENNIIDDSPCYIHRYRLYDEKQQSRFTDLMGFVIIELAKLPDASDGSAAWLWAKFIASESEAEMTELAKENKGIEKGRLTLVKLSADERAQYIAHLEERERRDWNASMKGAREEGEARGLAEGEAKGLAEGEAKGLAEGEAKERRANAERMKADGMDPALIAKYTELSPEEIAEL